jgi:hypothetical protein
MRRLGMAVVLQSVPGREASFNGDDGQGKFAANRVLGRYDHLNGEIGELPDLLEAGRGLGVSFGGGLEQILEPKLSANPLSRSLRGCLKIPLNPRLGKGDF